MSGEEISWSKYIFYIKHVTVMVDKFREEDKKPKLQAERENVTSILGKTSQYKAKLTKDKLSGKTA